MSPATSMFHSEMREAMRQARAPAPAPRKSFEAPRFPPKPLHRTVVRLWLPLTPIWIILAPFAILAAPLLLLVPQMRGARHPFRAAFAIGQVLFALSGTVVDVDTPDALVRVHIY
jgi:hypothetical protein